MKRIFRIAVAITMFSLTACLPFNGKREQLIVYSPRLATTVPSGALPQVEWQLAIETPLVSDTLNTTRILVMPTPGIIQIVKGGRWRDRVPLMLQSLLVQTFEDSGRIIGVGSTLTGLRADYAIVTELRDFQIEYVDNTPHAIIRLNVKLFDYASNRILATHSFNSDISATSRDIGGLTSAFEQALNQLLPQIVEWALIEGEAHWQITTSQ